MQIDLCVSLLLRKHTVLVRFYYLYFYCFRHFWSRLLSLIFPLKMNVAKVICLEWYVDLHFVWFSGFGVPQRGARWKS